MRKLTTSLLIFALMIAVSCSNESITSSSRSISQSQTPPEADLITTNGSSASTNEADIAAFINKYAGVYYGEGTHKYQEWGIPETFTGQMVYYKLKDGQVLTINCFNQSGDLLRTAQASVLPSANKLQISNYSKGTIEVLNLRDDGLDAYTSFILEKTSEEADTNDMQYIGTSTSLKAYKGTYKSVYDKKDKFLAIDEHGQVYYHEQVAKDNLFINQAQNELMIVKDGVRNTMVFEQGVYRKYDLTPSSDIDTTAITCEVSKDFIENIPVNKSPANYFTADFKTEPRWEGDIPQVTGFGITVNPKRGGPNGVQMEGGVFLSGAFGNRYKNKGTKASGDMVAHVTVLKGKTLHVMGRYDCQLTFSDDWKTLTYEGKTLNLR